MSNGLDENRELLEAPALVLALKIWDKYGRGGGGREWLDIRHITGGHAVTPIELHATVLEPRPHVAEAMRRIAATWEFSLAGQGGQDLDEIVAYRQELRTLLDVDCRFSFPMFAEGIYPIDFSTETARKLTTESIPDTMTPWIDWAPGTTPSTYTGRWTLFILSENCD